MALKIIAIGELKGWPKTAYSDYDKRLRAPMMVKSIELPTKDRKQEAKKILSHIHASDYCIALDPKGIHLSTEAFTDRLSDFFNKGLNPAFILGGPDGLDESILKRSQAKWSLSDMTLPHQLARIVLIEQIYRAYTILNNHPYHRA